MINCSLAGDIFKCKRSGLGCHVELWFSEMCMSLGFSGFTCFSRPSPLADREKEFGNFSFELPSVCPSQQSLVNLTND